MVLQAEPELNGEPRLKIIHRFEADILQWLGSRPIGEIIPKNY